MSVYLKICSKCDIEKEESEFYNDKRANDGLTSSCKECHKEYSRNNKARKAIYDAKRRITNKEAIAKYQKEYAEKNKDSLKEYKKKYYLENKESKRAENAKYREQNKEKIALIDKKYREKNREKLQEKSKVYREKHREEYKEYIKKRLKTDINFRLKHLLRVRIRHALQSNSKSERTHELLGCPVATFQEWISFNFKEGMTFHNIHIDHIRPCASFDLSDPKQQKRCFIWWNCQPLMPEENMRKHNSRDEILEKGMKERAKNFACYKKVDKYFAFLNDY
jgi:hypothetical protein